MATRVIASVCVAQEPCNRAGAAIPPVQRSLGGPAHLQLEMEMGMAAQREKCMI